MLFRSSKMLIVALVALCANGAAIANGGQSYWRLRDDLVRSGWRPLGRPPAKRVGIEELMGETDV